MITRLFEVTKLEVNPTEASSSEQAIPLVFVQRGTELPSIILTKVGCVLTVDYGPLECYKIQNKMCRASESQSTLAVHVFQILSEQYCPVLSTRLYRL